MGVITTHINRYYCQAWRV